VHGRNGRSNSCLFRERGYSLPYLLEGVPLGSEVDGKEFIDATENTNFSTKLKKIKQLRVSAAMQGTLCQAPIMLGDFSLKDCWLY